MNILNDSVLDKMQLFLDLSVKRQKVITSNLANVDTPGYQAKELDFQNVFRQELQGAGVLKTEDPRHISGSAGLARPVLVREPNTGALGNDLNNVDLDKEMSSLAENMLKFSAVSQLVQMKLQILESSVRGG